jgi:hypothetical protein
LPLIKQLAVITSDDEEDVMCAAGGGLHPGQARASITAINEKKERKEEKEKSSVWRFNTKKCFVSKTSLCLSNPTLF